MKPGIAFTLAAALAVVFAGGLTSSNARAAAQQTAANPASSYVGSDACATCHVRIYDRWKTTPMANIVRDPKVHPDAIIPDLSQPNPLVTFTKDDIAFVYGSLWKQRYFKKVGNDYFPLPAQWEVAQKRWSRYVVPATGGDWWAPHYPDPGDNSRRPTGPLCDGCHSVNYNIQTKLPSEWNVGCEGCHGPGGAHVASPSRANILNPAHLDHTAAVDVCVRCHSQGQPRSNPIQGQYYDWPVGFHVGLALNDYWRLEEHTLGETTFTHFADGTAHKNRMQGNDFVQSVMYDRGVTCFSCHDVHGTDNYAELIKPAGELCLTCHGPGSPNGPHTSTIEEHTHHKAGSAGNECVACHMPKIETEMGDVKVRSHTFKFIPPSETDSLKVPNSCNWCHTDQTTAWATAQLASWPEFSPWRVAP
jgi:predicted CXXCH cytochrome family protein